MWPRGFPSATRMDGIALPSALDPTAITIVASDIIAFISSVFFICAFLSDPLRASFNIKLSTVKPTKAIRKSANNPGFEPDAIPRIANPNRITIKYI